MVLTRSSQKERNDQTNGKNVYLSDMEPYILRILSLEKLPHTAKLLK